MYVIIKTYQVTLFDNDEKDEWICTMLYSKKSETYLS